MTRSFSFTLVIAFLLLCLMITTAGAVVQQVTVKGTVATVNEAKNTLTINNPAQYGCVYPASGQAICSYTPMTVSALTGTVPNETALTLFKPGDTIVATSIGGAGDTWITLAKLYGSRPNEAYVTDIVGDPETIPTPLIGNYTLSLATTPDCNLCSGTTCTASSSGVTIVSPVSQIFEKNLIPGQSLFYNQRNDGSSVAVAFVKGQAPSDTCPQVQAGMVGGVQPVSVYIVNVVPPIGYNQVNLRTATTTRPDEALPTTAVSTTATTAAPMSSPISTTTTPKEASFPFAAGCAFAIAGLAVFLRKH